MSLEKWSPETIIQCLEEYQKHPCLWDCTHPLYKNRRFREAAERHILEAMQIESCDLNTFRNKIRHIRNTYRQEVEKITVRRENDARLKIDRSGEGKKQTRVTKLVWFAVADDFLKKTMDMRYTKPKRDDMAKEKGETIWLPDQKTPQEDENPDSPQERPIVHKTIFKASTSRKRKPSDDPLEQHQPNQHPHQHQHHQQQQHQHVQLHHDSPSTPSDVKPSDVKDEFSIFADYVASELRTIGDRRALAVAKHNINTVLFEATTGMYNQQQQQQQKQSNGD